jgi:hypothetical protein
MKGENKGRIVLKLFNFVLILHPRYIPNVVLKSDVHIATVQHEARKYIARYRKRIDAHPNKLANALFQDYLGKRRLKRQYPGDLVPIG